MGRLKLFVGSFSLCLSLFYIFSYSEELARWHLVLVMDYGYNATTNYRVYFLQQKLYTKECWSIVAELKQGGSCISVFENSARSRGVNNMIWIWIVAAVGLLNVSVSANRVEDEKDPFFDNHHGLLNRFIILPKYNFIGLTRLGVLIFTNFSTQWIIKLNRTINIPPCIATMCAYWSWLNSICMAWFLTKAGIRLSSSGTPWIDLSVRTPRSVKVRRSQDTVGTPSTYTAESRPSGRLSISLEVIEGSPSGQHTFEDKVTFVVSSGVHLSIVKISVSVCIMPFCVRCCEMLRRYNVVCTIFLILFKCYSRWLAEDTWRVQYNSIVIRQCHRNTSLCKEYACVRWYSRIPSSRVSLGGFIFFSSRQKATSGSEFQKPQEWSHPFSQQSGNFFWNQPE